MGAKANELGMFCSNETQVFCTGFNKQVQGHCAVRKYSDALPPMFRYFSSPDMGGQVSIADYCPRAVQFSNGDCTQLTNLRFQNEAFGTKVGPEARCFVSSLVGNMYIPTGHLDTVC